MKKYFLKDGASQQGPFSLDELKGMNLRADTPIWYEGLAEWTTVGQLDEVKDIIASTPPPNQAPSTEGIKPAAAVVETTAVTASATATEKPAAITATAPAVKSSKKKTAWLSWVLYLLIIGGVGYFVYDDMEKNKEFKNDTLKLNSESESKGELADDKPADNPAEEKHEVAVTNDEAATVEPVAIDAPAADVKTVPPATNTTKSNLTGTTKEKAKTNIVPVPTKEQKAADEKKKQQAAQAAAAAAAAKEKEYRNNWPRYITIGQMDIKKDGDDGVEAFNVPVFNATNATLDKVTLRVDYMKKEKKVVKSETVVVYGIPPGAGLNGRAPESKKGNNIKVYITGVTSRKLHFCFPVNNGNSDDPYFCN